MAAHGRSRLTAAIVDQLRVGRPIGAFLAVGLAAFVMLLDLLEGPKTQYVGLLVATPFMAASFVSPLATVAAGTAAILLGGAYGAYEGVAGDQPQIIRLSCIAGATVLAALVSALRTRREVQMAQLAVVAEVAQQTVLRPLPGRIGGTEVAVAYVSSVSAARIGGDLYEVVDTPWGVRVLLGDVRGKGLEAVRLASQVLGSFRHVAQTEGDLGAVVAALDLAVARAGGEEDFVTAVVVGISPDSETMTILNCGHPNPILIADGRAEELLPPAPALPLGLGCEAVASTRAIRADDVILLYTDGLEEARSGDTFFDVGQAVEAAWGTDGLEPALARLQGAVTRFVGGHITDDIALVAFRPSSSGRIPTPVR